LCQKKGKKNGEKAWPHGFSVGVEKKRKGKMKKHLASGASAWMSKTVGGKAGGHWSISVGVTQKGKKKRTWPPEHQR
jgi:hypothetical protein